jgi:hypothetical protein
MEGSAGWVVGRAECEFVEIEHIKNEEKKKHIAFAHGVWPCLPGTIEQM